MIFARNPIYGTVKQRLAVDLGHERALDIYQRLLIQTLTLASDFNTQYNTPCWLWYANGIPTQSRFKPAFCTIHEQPSGHLGERMAYAFDQGLSHYTHVAIIGSDCWSLSQKHLQEAFEALNTHGFVIGPALDGGYYLLGANQAPPQGLFSHTLWGTSKVCQQAQKTLETCQHTYKLLSPLEDIDHPHQVPFS